MTHCTFVASWNFGAFLAVYYGIGTWCIDTVAARVSSALFFDGTNEGDANGAKQPTGTSSKGFHFDFDGLTTMHQLFN